MKIEYKNPVELEKLIPTDLAALYELGNLKDMEAELKANGLEIIRDGGRVFLFNKNKVFMFYFLQRYKKLC